MSAATHSGNCAVHQFCHFRYLVVGTHRAQLPARAAILARASRATWARCYSLQPTTLFMLLAYIRRFISLHSNTSDTLPRFPWRHLTFEEQLPENARQFDILREVGVLRSLTACHLLALLLTGSAALPSAIFEAPRLRHPDHDNAALHVQVTLPCASSPNHSRWPAMPGLRVLSINLHRWQRID